MVLLGPSTTGPLLPWGGLGRKAFCLFSLFLQGSAEVWTPVEARLTGLEETAGLSRALREGLAFPGLWEGAAPPSPVTFQVGLFPEPRCLLMSWGERLSALSPGSGPRSTSARGAGPGPAGSGSRPVPCASQACRGNWHAAANQVHLSELGEPNVTGSAFPAGAPPPQVLWCAGGLGGVGALGNHEGVVGRGAQAQVWVQVQTLSVPSHLILGRS